MRAVVLRSLVVIGIGALALVGVLYVATTVDTRPPQILGVELTQPVDDRPNRALITTSIEITFSEPVETDGAAAAIRFEPPIDGSVTWSGNTMVFTPAEQLELETEYTLVVGPRIRDLAGNEMEAAPAPYVFATGGRPRVSEVTPADGEDEVPVDAVISIVFSSLMDTASVEDELDLHPSFAHELRWSGQTLEILPAEPLEPDGAYTVTIGSEATDVAGVAIGEQTSVEFRTIAPGLLVEAVVPASGVDGIAPATAIHVVLDRPIEPGSVSRDLLEISPELGGSLEIIALPGEPEANRVLRFTPSSPLPRNTTFELTLLPGIRNESGGGLAEPYAWTFTTGAPGVTLSNQITFISDRSGIPNVWAMNPDGTGQHQVSSELAPILDYAVAPNGGSLVVGDGRHLVFLSADGSDRQLLTDEGRLEFDAAYAPDATRVAFARADAETGEGLGLWIWEVGAGGSSPVELPRELRTSPLPTPTDERAPQWLRAPRFAPDGQALAFLDLTGHVGVVELPAERLTRASFGAEGPPMWVPDSSAVIVNGRPDPGRSAPSPFVDPVAPLEVGEGAEPGVLFRSGTRVETAGFGDGARVSAIAADARILYRDADDRLRLAEGSRNPGRVPRGLDDAQVAEAWFGPGEAFAVIVLRPPDGIGPGGAVERVDFETGERTPLTDSGWRVRWVP